MKRKLIGKWHAAAFLVFCFVFALTASGVFYNQRGKLAGEFGPAHDGKGVYVVAFSFPVVPKGKAASAPRCAPAIPGGYRLHRKMLY